MGKISLEERKREFVSKLKSSHPHLVLSGQFTTVNCPTRFFCKKHKEEFETKPYRLLASKSPNAGCKLCTSEQMRVRKTMSHEVYCERIRELGVVPVERYTHSQTAIQHRCACGNLYSTTPASVLQYGCLCRDCGRRKIAASQRRSAKFYQDRIDQHHGKNKIELLKHGPSDRPSKFRCLTCDQVWSSRFSSVVNSGTGCPACASLLNKKGFSRSEMEWLSSMEDLLKIEIRHVDNLGQYRVPGTKYRVDGYHEATRTVFEFYGDAFHGNLNVFRRYQNPNPFNRSLTTIKMYRKTMQREQHLRNLGYKVISIWENEYKTHFDDWKRELVRSLS